MLVLYADFKTIYHGVSLRLILAWRAWGPASQCDGLTSQHVDWCPRWVLGYHVVRRCVPLPRVNPPVGVERKLTQVPTQQYPDCLRTIRSLAASPSHDRADHLLRLWQTRVQLTWHDASEQQADRPPDSSPPTNRLSILITMWAHENHSSPVRIYQQHNARPSPRPQTPLGVAGPDNQSLNGPRFPFGTTKTAGLWVQWRGEAKITHHSFIHCNPSACRPPLLFSKK